MELDTIVCGDCLDVMGEMEDRCVDLVVTSPPYDRMRNYGGFSFDFRKVAHSLFRVIKRGRIVVWIVGDETKNFCESLTSFKQAVYFVDEIGFNLLDTMMYRKLSYPPAYPSLRRYVNVFEYMFVFSKGKPLVFNELREAKTDSTLHRQKYKHFGGYRQRDGSIKKGGGLSDKETKARTNVWRYKPGGNYTNDKFALKHPAVFPEELVRDHILTWSNPGELVFDPLMGSGTAAKMALLTNRHFYGCDINPEYVKIANKRIEKARLEMAQMEMDLTNSTNRDIITSNPRPTPGRHR